MLNQLAAQTSVALFLVDQRMPQMTGVEFLEEAQKLYPDTRAKVLLTAYADTEAAIASINKVGLDHYLMKPWGPAGGQFHPILDDLLGDWWATTPMLSRASAWWHVVVARLPHGEGLSGSQSHPNQWLDIEKDGESQTLVEAYSAGRLFACRCSFPDGTSLIEPDLAEIALKAGMQTMAAAPFYDLIIIGGGPAGWARPSMARRRGYRRS